MAAITRAGKVPLLVGGTIFYFHALEFGLSRLPSADPDIRARLSEEAAKVGWSAMHQRLQVIDPASAARIHPHDAQRIQRALEIHVLTGQSPSTLNTANPAVSLPYRVVKIALWPQDRRLLHERIERRFHAMLLQGFVEEVEQLYRRHGLIAGMPSLRTVGYRQIWEYLTNRINYNEMIGQAIAATRQFAKRQITWLRKYTEVYAFDSSNILPEKECLNYLRETMRL